MVHPSSLPLFPLCCPSAWFSCLLLLCTLLLTIIFSSPRWRVAAHVAGEKPKAKQTKQQQQQQQQKTATHADVDRIKCRWSISSCILYCLGASPPSPPQKCLSGGGYKKLVIITINIVISITDLFRQARIASNSEYRCKDICD